MLEILLLVHLGKKVAAKARGRGWAGWPWVLVLVFGWFGSLLVGVIASSIAYLATHPGEEEAPLFLALASAYAVAACFAIGLFFVVGKLPAAELPDEFDDDEEYDDRPRRAVRRKPEDPYAEHERRYTDDEDERRGDRR